MQNKKHMQRQEMRNFCVFIAVLATCWTSDGRTQTSGAGHGQAAGPNVCAIEEVTGSHKRYFSDVTTYQNRQICGKNTFLRYYCCSGFDIKKGSEGCHKVNSLENLFKVFNQLQLQNFNEYITRNDALIQKVSHLGPYTIFAPENMAFLSMDPEISHGFITDEPQQNLVLYHMVQDRHYIRDLDRNLTVSSLYGTNAAIRINIYRGGIVTVNCARVILPDQLATNGLVHIIDRVIRPIDSSSSTVMELLLFAEDLGKFVSALVRTELANDLRASAGDYTVFAPSDEAFRSAPAELLQRVLGDKQLVLKLLRHHIIAGSLCSSAILGPTPIQSLEGQNLDLTCDVSDTFNVNGASVSKADNLAMNGVVHIIDQLLIPDSVKTLADKAHELGLNNFLHYANQAGIINSLMRQTSTNYTLMIPSQDAFANLTKYETNRFDTADNYDWLLGYHVVEGQVTTRQMIGDQLLPTYHSIYHDTTSLITKVYSDMFGVNNARIISGDHVVSNGVIHIIDHVLWPPIGTVMDKIKNDPELRTFWSLLRISGLDRILIDDRKLFTVFAPTDMAFESMDTSSLEKVMNNNDILIQFLHHHMLPSSTYLRTHHEGWHYRLKTMLDDWILIRRESKDSRDVIDGLTDVIERDIQATNGVLHKTATVINCSCLSEDA